MKYNQSVNGDGQRKHSAQQQQQQLHIIDELWAVHSTTSAINAHGDDAL